MILTREILKELTVQQQEARFERVTCRTDLQKCVQRHQTVLKVTLCWRNYSKRGVDKAAHDLFKISNYGWGPIR